MKICLVTTNEETIFIPKGVNYLTEHLGPNIDIYCVPGFTSLKRFLYSIVIQQVSWDHLHTIICSAQQSYEHGAFLSLRVSNHKLNWRK